MCRKSGCKAYIAKRVLTVGSRSVWPRGPRLQNKAEAGKECERRYEDTKTTEQQNNHTIDKSIGSRYRSQRRT